MYLISPLTDPGVQLGKHVEMPSVLQCPEIHESVHETRLWMSSGNSSSSLHFDTHENLMLQVFGTKSVYMFPPSQSHKTYMDYHDRYGLSPVHPERVDLDKWPMFAQLEGGMVAHLHGGDALMIPEGWWHQVRTRPGRNAAVTWEFEPYEELLNNFWPADNFGRLWSSQVL
jgi:lysine-specific demethylase 8